MNENQCCGGSSECINEETPNTPQSIASVTEPVFRYNINIEPLNRGFVVRVGCQSFAVSSKQELIKLFAAYIENPEKVETNWMIGGKLPE